MRKRLSALLRPTTHGAGRVGRALLAALTVACMLLLPVSASFAHDRGRHGYGYARPYYGERYHREWHARGWSAPRYYRPFVPPPPLPAWRYYHPHHHRWYYRY